MKKSFFSICLITGAALFATVGNATAAYAGDIAGTEDPCSSLLHTYEIADSFAGGLGSPEDPYLISDASQLARLSHLVSHEELFSKMDYRKASYQLTADIVLNDPSDFENWTQTPPANTWLPIGEEGSFTGSFDGNGHTISGMYVCASESDDTAANNPGLFGDVYGGTISNLTVTDSLIVVADGALYAGGLGSHISASTIDHCSVDVCIHKTTDQQTHIGGLAGSLSDSSLTDSSAGGSLSFSDNCVAGGLAGLIIGDHFLLKDCVSDVTLKTIGELTSFNKAGGLAGEVIHGLDCEITGCENHMKMNLGDALCGGLIGILSLSDRDNDLTDGYNDPNGHLTITNCKNLADITVTGDEPAAGLIGRIHGSASYQEAADYTALTILECQNEGTISGNAYAAGLIGEINAKTGWEILSCSNNGSVFAEKEAAGIVAELSACEKTNVLKACINNGTVESASGHAGGIACNYFGFSLYVKEEKDVPLQILECINYGNITGKDSIQGLGGILGSIKATESCVQIDACSNYGTLQTSGFIRAGGILGDGEFSNYNTYKGICYLITNCENHGEIIHGDGSRTFTAEEFSPSELSEEVRENYSKDDVNTAILVMGGPAIGGIIGYQNNGSVLSCTNDAAIRLDKNDQPALHHADVMNLAYAENGPTLVFTGGICGLYLFDKEDSVEITSLKDCIYGTSAPIGYYAPLLEEGIENIR